MVHVVHHLLDQGDLLHADTLLGQVAISGCLAREGGLTAQHMELQKLLYE